jgi:indole-3-glycerol phosphate synthase
MAMTSKIPSILLKICEKKKQEVELLYKSGLADKYKHESANQPPTKSFVTAISKPGMNLIAEFKKASPSKGDIRPGVEPEEIVKLYEENGASAISVLTDSHFKGEIDYLKRVRNTVSIPILRFHY